MNTSPESGAQAALQSACARIAPNWPLDRLIAVNPWWHWRDQPFAEASARLATLGHVHCLMPRDYYLALWQRPVQAHHLGQACTELGLAEPVEQLLADTDPALPRQWYNISDLVDAQRPASAMSWHEEIIHQISQFCGDLLQQGHPQELDANRFYQAWLDVTRADRGLAILMEEPRLGDAFSALPNRVEDLFELAMNDLAACPEHIEAYGLALLLDINGWAASLAWLNWEASLTGSSNDALAGLLAARLAWDWVLWKLNRDADWDSQWQNQWHNLPALISAHAAHQRQIMAWQRAAEIATQESLINALSGEWSAAPHDRPVLQAAFCIDVRSEVIRRALEAQHPGIQTLGFAGFFGLPLGYRATPHAPLRPQLPGLLAPALEVTAARTSDALQTNQALSQRWQLFSSSAPTTFTAVESSGLMYLFKLLKQSLFPGNPHHPVNQEIGNVSLALEQNGEPLALADKARLGATVLKAMGLRSHLAPRVLLVGHGSSTCNNPHAAGLDCGACGGQTGEINVRVLAQLLNDPAVRQALPGHGIDVPDDTRFVAALHDTTTDEIRCFTQSSGDIDGPLCDWLSRASEQARQERAPALGLRDRFSVGQQMTRISRDWSQVRPEWGLAGNHSFIVAPRARTRHLNLHGQSFLHDYDWHQDADFQLLETIMTAPMIVTHWINMQYNASVTDPAKFGSGSKVLHNVVGGNLGVFEGNGGDLRIGLPLQSVHDGQKWMHQPLRLSVFIAAPEDAIRAVYRRHDTVRQLVDNHWLSLFHLGDTPGTVSRLVDDHWHLQTHNTADHQAA